MGRRAILLPIHGAMLKGFILGHCGIDEFAKEMNVSRQTVHSWTSGGRISPRHLSDAVRILNLSAEDVRLLERTEQTAIEKKLTELRYLRSALVDIKRLVDAALERS